MRLIIFLFLSLITPIAYSNDSLMLQIDSPEAAKNFTLPDTTGNMVSLFDYKGKYVLINFWADWCSPCKKEFPAMQALYESLQEEDLEIIAIHAGPVTVDITSFLSKNKISFKVVLDEQTSLKGWTVPALPISYLVSPEGKLVYEATGIREWNANEMRKLMISGSDTINKKIMVNSNKTL